MKKVKPHAVDWAQIERFLASADKKLASAHKILAFDEEACLQQAYEAMLASEPIQRPCKLCFGTAMLSSRFSSTVMPSAKIG